MRYYAAQTTLKNGKALGDLIRDQAPQSIELGQSVSFHVPLGRPQLIEPPDEFFFPKGEIVGIECDAVGEMGRGLRGNARIEPSAFRTPVTYTNRLTGEKRKYSLDQLPLGLEYARPGSYYFLMHPLRYYYCEKVENGLVNWFLVESFQSESLFRAHFTQELQYSRHYMPVSNKAVIRRLKARLEEVKR